MLAIRNPFYDFNLPRSGASSFDDLRSELDRVFTELERVGRPASSGRPGFRSDFRDEGQTYVFEAEVPGVREEDIDVQVTAGAFTVTADRKVAAPEGHATSRQERRAYRLSRSFHLPDAVLPDQADASLADGVLTVRLPKVPEATPKKLTVKAG